MRNRDVRPKHVVGPHKTIGKAIAVETILELGLPRFVSMVLVTRSTLCVLLTVKSLFSSAIPAPNGSGRLLSER